MGGLSAIVLLGTLAAILPTLRANNAMSGSGCLCTSDQPCWPSAAAFSQLETQLSQPLIYPVPSASACYPPSDPPGDCTDVITNWNNTTWRASHPGSMELANFETYTFQNGTINACFLNTSITGMCGQGRVPVIGADVRSVADIQAAIGFAVDHSLKLVVKNTGHDLVGRSTARDAFMVWTHNMKNIKYDAAFVPQDAPGNETFQAMTLGAGVQWGEAYLAAIDHGRMIVGGSRSSIGASGGWLAGGGHSFLSPSYGLGVDNALEISVVLSTGEYLITNEYQNSDLFWALRGGGGGTYGIVTSVTYRTYPIVPLQTWNFQANTTNSSMLPELVEGLLRYQTQFTNDGWGGYGGITNQGIYFGYYAPNMTNETVTATTQSWLKFTRSLEPYGVVHSSETTPYSWNDVIHPIVYGRAHGGIRGGEYLMLSSRLLSRDTVANHYSQVAQLLIEYNSGITTVVGGRVSQFGADSAGLNPAWRNAAVEAVYKVDWEENTSSKDIQAKIQQLKGRIQAMYDVTPNDGAYFNEGSSCEVEWQKTYFGAHYSTLKRIKDKYDPYRLFVVREGVGSENWNKDLTCRYGSY